MLSLTGQDHHANRPEPPSLDIGLHKTWNLTPDGDYVVERKVVPSLSLGFYYMTSVREKLTYMYFSI